LNIAHDEPDGFQVLQQRVAARHHVLLDPDDPIAMLQTCNELLVEQAAAALEQAQAAILTKFGHEIEQVTSAWKHESKDLAERTLAAARRAGAEQIEQASQALLSSLRLERERMAKTVRRSAIFNVLVFLGLLTALAKLWLH
jgi:thioredoxin-like negative regulator of GroEL